MVDIRDISFSYSRGGRSILDQVSFQAEAGLCTAVLGTNGAGKSTLLKCIDRILHPGRGQVTVDNEDMFSVKAARMAQKIAYVPQNADIADMTVFDMVLLGRKPYIKWDVTARDKEIALEIISRMGLEDYMLRRVSELSGGEVQKVLLARALAQQPRLLLLDEPTSNLDPKNQHKALQTVRAVAREHEIAVLMVLHDLNLALRYCDRFLFLKDAGIFSYGGPEVMTPENIEAVYDMHVHMIEYMGIPVMVPFPDVVSGA